MLDHLAIKIAVLVIIIIMTCRSCIPTKWIMVKRIAVNVPTHPVSPVLSVQLSYGLNGVQNEHGTFTLHSAVDDVLHEQKLASPG